MNSELDVRSAGLDADLADDGDRSVTHHLVFTIGEGLGGSNRDRVTGVYAHGIEVFDRADDDDVVFQIAHHLELELFPSQDRLFDERFVHRGEIETAGENVHQLFAVVGDTSAGTAECERGANNDRETDFPGELEAVFEIVDQRRLGDVEADLLHRVFEEETVFGLLDGFNIRANQLEVVLFEHAVIGQLDGKVERGLAANRGQDGKSRAGRHLALNTNDFFQIFAGERLDVSAVGGFGIGHDGGRVRVG